MKFMRNSFILLSTAFMLLTLTPPLEVFSTEENIIQLNPGQKKEVETFLRDIESVILAIEAENFEASKKKIENLKAPPVIKDIVDLNLTNAHVYIVNKQALEAYKELISIGRSLQPYVTSSETSSSKKEKRQRTESLYNINIQPSKKLKPLPTASTTAIQEKISSLTEALENAEEEALKVVINKKIADIKGYINLTTDETEKKFWGVIIGCLEELHEKKDITNTIKAINTKTANFIKFQKNPIKSSTSAPKSMSQPSYEEQEKFHIIPISSESKERIGTFICDEMKHAKQDIILVSDQFTDKSLADCLIKFKSTNPTLQINVLVGDNTDGLNTEKILVENNIECTAILSDRTDENGIRTQEKNEQERNIKKVHTKYIKAKGNSKMHNKFIIIDDDKLLIGSPNATQNGYTNNVESLVIIQNLNLVKLYKNYYQYILETASMSRPKQEHYYDPFREKTNAIIRLSEDYNKRHSKVKVCLAPACNIVDFIGKSLEDANDIKINMFLISNNGSNKQVIDQLINISNSPGKKIMLNIDNGQYIHPNNVVKETIDYIVTKKTLPNFLGDKQNFEIRRIVLTKPGYYFHDKLFLIQKGDKKLVLLGSSGLSRDVAENNNYESMILIEDDSTYDFFNDRHFNRFIPHSREDENISSIVSEIWKISYDKPIIDIGMESNQQRETSNWVLEWEKKRKKY